jgi:hypothetical protein
MDEKTCLRKLFCALREQNRRLPVVRGARWSYRGPFFSPRGARCENKINYYIARRVLQTNS